MSDFQHLTVEHDPDKRLWLTLRTQNSLRPETVLLLKELSTALSAATESALPNGIIIVPQPASNAPPQRPFTAAQPDSLQQLAAVIELAQTVGQQLQGLETPSIVLLTHSVDITEMSLALAATYCISCDDRAMQLAFKEISHGLHPNRLSTQQAVRRMGAATAMDYLLSSRPLSPAHALSQGLIDACVAQAELSATAIDFLTRRPTIRRAGFGQRLCTLAPLRKPLSLTLHDKVQRIGRPEHYPAPYALLGLWEKYGLNDTVPAQQAYQRSTQHLSQTQQATHLNRLAQLSQQLRHTDFNRPEHTLQQVCLIGSGETACRLIAHMLPWGVNVTLCNHLRSDGDELKQLVPAVKQTLADQGNVSESQLNSMLNQLFYDPKGQHLATADLILVLEDLNLADSQELFAELEEKASPDAILATHQNTHALDTIAAALLNPQRLIGLHFCHSAVPEGIKLVEIALNHKTDHALYNSVQRWLRQCGDMTLTTRSSPGQLVNRTLLQYVFQGIRLHQQGVPHAYIDRAGHNCGMPVGPLELADRLGLDYCLRLAEALQKAQRNIEIPYSLREKVSAQQWGIKSGSGFYRYRNGNRLKKERIEWNGSEQALQEKLVGQICEEAAICLEEGLLDSPDVIDAGIIFGAGFAPYPGGPLYQQRHHAAHN